MVNSLGASGNPALQSFLSHILDSRNRLFLFTDKKMFFGLMTAGNFGNAGGGNARIENDARLTLPIPFLKLSDFAPRMYWLTFPSLMHQL
jgi:hypothetical protein